MRKPALFLVIALCACGGGSPQTAQPSASGIASELMPAELKPTPTPGEVGKFRVRVFADDAHRAQSLNWERNLEAMLRRADSVLGPTAGIEFEIVEAKQWTRKAAKMSAMLAELEDLDPAIDVHLVVGLIDALPGVSSTFEQLGVARPLGKHLVMRGLNDAKEVEVLEAALRDLDRKARDQLYGLRGKHKMTLVFLHEFAHVLGGIHVGSDLRILSGTYDIKQDAFSKENAALLRIAASFRKDADPGADRTDELKAIAAHLKGAAPGDWIPKDLQTLQGALTASQSSELDRATTLSDLSEHVRSDHRKLYREAVRLADDGSHLEAWEKTEPLLDFYREEPAVVVLACRLASARKLEPATVAKYCRRAAALAPGDITPALTLAITEVDANNAAKAVSILGAARTRLLGVTGEHNDAWLRLAGAYKKLGLVTLAADAAERSKDGGDIAAWAKAITAKYSVLPADSKARTKRFPASADSEYVTAMKEALKLVYARNFAGALKLAAAADKKFGKTPGTETVRCDLEIRRRNYPKARSYCARSLKLYEAGSWAHYLSGLLSKQAKQNAKAIVSLERALELDPSLRHGYEILAGLLDQSGAKEKAAELRAAYKKRFGSGL